MHVAQREQLERGALALGAEWPAYTLTKDAAEKAQAEMRRDGLAKEIEYALAKESLMQPTERHEPRRNVGHGGVHLPRARRAMFVGRGGR